MQQIYGNYTEEDFEVWDILYKRQIELFPTHASEAYLFGLKSAGFDNGKIPRFNATNSILSEATGWSLAVVPGIVPDYTFFELMSNRRFPATTWLRKKKEIDYLQEPDMFHDVFAHVPLLTNQHFVNFLQELSKIALEHIGDDRAIELLSRVYWFTVEFGLINEEGGLRIFGAGILSSFGETRFCVSDEAVRYPFSVAHTMDTPYKKDEFQAQYFVIDSYEQLYHAIPEIRNAVEVRLRAARQVA